jgi:hypothetical protein
MENNGQWVGAAWLMATFPAVARIVQNWTIEDNEKPDSESMQHEPSVEECGHRR